MTVLCWNRPSMSSFGFAKSVVFKKRSHQEICSQLHYFLANVSLKLCSLFVMGLTEMWPLWRSIASSKPRFHPTFPWFSELTSCWEALALASGSVEITSCSESSWMRLFAQVPFSVDKGCGILLKSWGRGGNHPSLLTAVVLQGWWGFLSSHSEALRGFRGRPGSPEAPQKSCAWSQEDLFRIHLCCCHNCVHSGLAGVRGFVPSRSTQVFQLVPGRQMLSPSFAQSAAAKKLFFLLLSAILTGITLQSVCVVNKWKQIIIIKRRLTSFSQVVVAYGLEGNLRELGRGKSTPCPLSLTINKQCRRWELMWFVLSDIALGMTKGKTLLQLAGGFGKDAS